MGLLNKLFGKEDELIELNVSDDDIVAIADGEIIDIHTVSDAMFADELMGKSLAFKFNKKTKLCSPVNGILNLVFPTGHAFGVVSKGGMEILVHCGVDTVKANGNGFKVLKKQGESIKAGEPVVEVDINKLSQNYDMSTMLIITNSDEHDVSFIAPQPVVRGQTLRNPTD